MRVQRQPFSDNKLQDSTYTKEPCGTFFFTPIVFLSLDKKFSFLYISTWGYLQKGGLVAPQTFLYIYGR